MRTKLIVSLLVVQASYSFSQEVAVEKERKIEIGLQLSTPETYAWNTDPTDQQSQYAYLWGISKSSSIGKGVFFQYDLKKKFALRIRGNYTYSYLQYIDTTYDSFNNSYEIYKFKYSQNIFVIAPGIISKHSIEKFTFYGCMEIPFKIFGDIHKSHTHYYYQNDLFEGHAIDNYDVDGGIAFGIGGSLGFHYSLGKRFLIGPEFSESLLYHYVNGKTRITNTSYDTNGNITYGNPQQKISKKSGIMNPLPVFSLNVSFRI
jgi:hypothetical protein